MINEQDIKELVIARLQTLPEGKELSMGASGDFTKEALIEHVQAGDEIGQRIIDVEMTFLRALKDGIFYDHDTARHAA
jgi:hypothetical protein